MCPKLHVVRYHQGELTEPSELHYFKEINGSVIMLRACLRYLALHGVHEMISPQ